MADKLKFVIALALVVAGVAGYYLLSEQMMVLRVLAVLVGVAAGCAVAWKTTQGRDFVVYAQESVVEAKKVVWPSRKDTMQTTAIVFVFVLVMALMLWLTDKGLEWLLYDIVLGWKKL